MSDNPPRPPSPVPQRKRTPTGDSKVQPPPTPDAVKPAPEQPSALRQRKRSGAMRAITRPDNPLAVFKAKEQQALVATPPPEKAAHVTAPPIPAAPRPAYVAPPVPPAVPPPPRTPPKATSSLALPLAPPPRPARAAPPTLPAPVHSAPPPLPPPVLTAPPPLAPPPATAVAPERLDITVSAVPHPRLTLPPALSEPAQATPATEQTPEPAALDLLEPVTTSPNVSPAPRKTRKRTALAISAVAAIGALALGAWFVPSLHGRAAPSAAKAPVPAASPKPAPASQAAALPTAARATPPTPAPAPAAPALQAPSKPSETGIPWLDGEPTQGCVPASAPAGAVSFEDVAKSQQALAKGRRLLMQGELSASLSALCGAAQLNPQHSGLAFEVARAALIARDGVTAARFAEHSLALTPPERRSREILADALAWQGNVEAARAAWLGIHKLSTPSEKTFTNLALGAAIEARTAAKAGDYATAERYLRRSLAFDPENADTTMQLARVLLMAGHHAVAARWVERALALDATDPDRQVLAGEIQSKLGNTAAASGHYSRALELDPQNAIAKLRLRAQNL